MSHPPSPRRAALNARQLIVNPGGAQIGKPETAADQHQRAYDGEYQTQRGDEQGGDTWALTLFDRQKQKLAAVEWKSRDQVDHAKTEIEIGERPQQQLQKTVRRRPGYELIAEPSAIRREKRRVREQREQYQSDRQVGEWSGERDGDILPPRVRELPKLH